MYRRRHKLLAIIGNPNHASSRIRTSGQGEMDTVFRQADIAGIPFRNRIIRSATHEGLADERGEPTDGLIRFYERIALGGAGAIITGEACVHRSGRSSGYRPLMIDGDGLIPSYRRVTDAVHATGCPIILQLQHAGRQTTSAATGETPVAPSALRDSFYSEETPRALEERDIGEIIESFIAAADRARRSGFDGVQLLAAHGYLLSEFLSPAANRRSDRWGGSLENRFRMLGLIMRGIRERCGSFPVLVKLNASEAARGGMMLPEAVRIALLLEREGCVAIEVSRGTFADGLNSIRGPELPLEPAYRWIPKYRDFSTVKKRLFRIIAPLLIRRHRPYCNYNETEAAEIKRHVNMPVIVVGGIRRMADIARIIREGAADAVSMCRPFIIEPDIVNKFREAKQEESRCIMCNYCSIGLMAGPLRCYRGRIAPGG